MAWSNAIAITIDHTKVPNTDQINFPFMFIGKYPQLATVANGGSVINANGYDIIFASDSLGVSPLSFERCAWNALNGASIFYVNISTLSHTVDTVIYILFGNAAIITDQQSTATWNANYQAVYHFAKNSPIRPVLLDSTSFLNNATGISGFNTASTPGSFNQLTANSIVGTANPSAPASASWSFTDFTISCWIKTSINRAGIIAIQNGNPLIYMSIGPTTAGGNSNVLVGYLRTNGGGLTVANGSVSLIDGNWHHVQLVRTTSVSAKIYVDGVIDTTTTYSDSGTINASGQGINMFTVGGFGFTGPFFDLRISNSVRTADWISTEYNNQKNPNTFYSTSLTTQTLQFFDWWLLQAPPPSRSTLALTTTSNPIPVAQNLAGGINGTAYSETISVQGGTTPYTFSVSAGSLPTGLSLNSTTGLINGTPTVNGTYNFTINIVDNSGFIGTQPFQIIVASQAGGSWTFVS